MASPTPERLLMQPPYRDGTTPYSRYESDDPSAEDGDVPTLDEAVSRWKDETVAAWRRREKLRDAQAELADVVETL